MYYDEHDRQMNTPASIIPTHAAAIMTGKSAVAGGEGQCDTTELNVLANEHIAAAA